MRHTLRSLLVLAALALGPLGSSAAARPAGPILHEPIPPDPAEDLALGVALDGDLPAALRTPHGLVPAPDPRRPPLPSDPAYSPDADGDAFVPDRDTKRPDVSGYDEPFSPSTAPFKRFEAFDGVRSDYKLYVRDPRLVAVPTDASPGPGDDVFYADLVVDAKARRNVRIPSIGPGARIVHARLGVGPDEMPLRVVRDGADNWFLQVYGGEKAVRSRLVMEIAVARAAFGGQFGDPDWSALPLVPALPDSVAREAAAVRSALRVSRHLRPRQAVAKLVQYFRGFAESDDPPRGRGSVYLDLALSKKGVCRHRAFAFLVTSLSLGIPTRFVANEAHAWVEVHDGAQWRRIDLGGAGRMSATASGPLSSRQAYEPPPDFFSWPQNAQRGGDMMAGARVPGESPSGAASAMSPGWASTGGGNAGAAPPQDQPGQDDGAPVGGSIGTKSSSGSASATSGLDDRPGSSLTIVALTADARRGSPLRLNGTVRAEGEPCPHLAVELWLRAVGTRRSFLMGTLATGDDGAYAGEIVVPGEAPLGDYDVIARTSGDARCGAGSSD